MYHHLKHHLFSTQNYSQYGIWYYIRIGWYILAYFYVLIHSLKLLNASKLPLAVKSGGINEYVVTCIGIASILRIIWAINTIHGDSYTELLLGWASDVILKVVSRGLLMVSSLVQILFMWKVTTQTSTANVEKVAKIQRRKKTPFIVILMLIFSTTLIVECK